MHRYVLWVMKISQQGYFPSNAHFTQANPLFIPLNWPIRKIDMKIEALVINWYDCNQLHVKHCAMNHNFFSTEIKIWTITAVIWSEFELTLMQHVTRSARGVWQCGLCSLSSTKKSNVLCHVESKHVQMGGWQCKLCQEVKLELHELSARPLYSVLTFSIKQGL